MNKCNKCQALFEAPATETIMHYEVDTRQEELIPVCPECGSEEFEEVQLCRACNKHYIASSNDFCETCIQDTTWCIDQIQRLTGCDWETAKELAQHVIEEE